MSYVSNYFFTVERTVIWC